ncbi:unnamed protein product [Clonostachys rosea]|uniref:Transcription factor IIA alpha/beta subunit n=1 Tax=Bionectria ochroleuca TaxID=29856 RepID=A0ABY6UES5_BIOOC|nr:unnamed protein product [Clonostachys rosea]
MSNQAVGGVYQTIIEEVINSSRVDFEENGVEESVLEELRLGWQQKLSQLDVAQFPWDPKPEPPPPAMPVQPVNPAPAQNHPIKAEPSSTPQLPPVAPIHNGMPDQMQIPGGFNGVDNKSGNVAANRASQLIQQQYGNRATGSINAIQDQMGQQISGQPQQVQLPPLAQQGQHMIPQQQGQHLPAPNGQHHLHNAQTDGAGDAEGEFEAILMRRGITGDLEELGRVDIDSILHEQIAARAKAMEGGGLMLPLKEATKHRAAGSSKPRSSGIGAHDGAEDEDDEDAINSDLDDPEEDRSDDEVDDEGLGHIMLCMYDKVQRVKNKWKCTLKDGVLTVNGKEYVFHKATGEYEW